MKLVLFENAKLILEATAVFGAMLLFWFHPSIKQARSKPSVRAVAFAVALLFVVQGVAQVTTRNQYNYPQKYEPFPFTRWAMFAGFTTSVPSGSVYDWRGVTASGAGVQINPAHLYLTPNAVVLFTKTQSLGDQIPFECGEPAASVKDALDAFSRGLLARFNVVNHESQIIRVELWRRHLPLQRGAEIPAPFSEHDSKLVHAYEEQEP
jgi:hypothetical protein